MTYDQWKTTDRSVEEWEAKEVDARIEHDYTLTGPDITDLLIALEQRIERLEEEILDIRCFSPNSVDAMNALYMKATRLRHLSKMFEFGFETVIKNVGYDPA